MSPQVIIMDEPTRGIDIGAKEQIHKTIAELTRKNMAVILISSEMQEIIGASDRIMVLYKGKLMAEFPVNAQLTQEIIMTAASGIDTYQSIRAG
jgi:ABC-type sugar transport system ATPase subunit